MAGFLKVLFRNLLEGPCTDPYPFGKTFSPPSIRGKVLINPELCMGCGMCVYSCTAKAINITPLSDASGYTITVWRNTCCLCASCKHYCPMGAMSISDDWHLAHAADEKYALVERHTIKFTHCSNCGAMIRPLPLPMLKRLYAASDVDPEKIRSLCPKCRQIEAASQIVQNSGADAAKAENS
ncbi:MAG: 4Fe-4S binding protein [Desulfovibrio sp.]|jgi:NAD-dependent dihydropyrimidine dehydrogenase PreA subunit|nr:4Fe-4S binding protein [Desulfovibrio sp.]